VRREVSTTAYGGDLRVERRLGLDRCEGERIEFAIALGRIGDRCGCLEVTQGVRRLAVGHAGVVWRRRWASLRVR
jgi:hypothetical protein